VAQAFDRGRVLIANLGQECGREPARPGSRRCRAPALSEGWLQATGRGSGGCNPHRRSGGIIVRTVGNIRK
jgi:hypothetical protein